MTTVIAVADSLGGGLSISADSHRLAVKPFVKKCRADKARWIQPRRSTSSTIVTQADEVADVKKASGS
ncbi:hypothetical protein RB10462 [Rhodopirellula baltica SH 1]|uniref:Uncharacterized protein n=1 Tax=Rhodopirellula baltica (strain DSM 10527 / NCIMB 13988 / SH1) TaxID=243090 RepID=Q7UEY9_RHOBA|nr:hypothetical protein RB10462 [Rhodopirellula baltica SH 1]